MEFLGIPSPPSIPWKTTPISVGGLVLLLDVNVLHRVEEFKCACVACPGDQVRHLYLREDNLEQRRPESTTTNSRAHKP